MSKTPGEGKPATRLATGGRRPEWTGAVVNPPVWRGSTHLYASEGERKRAAARNRDGDFFYGRRGSPTQWALSDALTAIEPGAAGTVLYPSGLAALVGAMLAVLEAGDTVLICDNAYDPTRNTGLGLLKRFGITARFFDPLDVDGFAEQIDDSCKAVMFENPGSLTMEVCDIPALAKIAGDHGLVRMIDNTWATALGFPALERGCDITIQALTKHVGGHSDLLMGSASAGETYYPKLRATAQALGHVVSPDDAALALRGLRTMGLRLESTTRSALAIAHWLCAREDVSAVLYPAMPGAPGHDLWQRDFTGACGLFSFLLDTADSAARARFVDALELFGIGYSWGGFESLALPFDPGSIRDTMPFPPSDCGGGEGLGIRLSIGLEDTDDLIRDLERGFAALKGD